MAISDPKVSLYSKSKLSSNHSLISFSLLSISPPFIGYPSLTLASFAYSFISLILLPTPELPCVLNGYMVFPLKFNFSNWEITILGI